VDELRTPAIDNATMLTLLVYLYSNYIDRICVLRIRIVCRSVCRCFGYKGTKTYVIPSSRQDKRSEL